MLIDLGMIANPRQELLYELEAGLSIRKAQHMLIDLGKIANPRNLLIIEPKRGS